MTQDDEALSVFTHSGPKADTDQTGAGICPPAVPSIHVNHFYHLLTPVVYGAKERLQTGECPNWSEQTT